MCGVCVSEGERMGACVLMSVCVGVCVCVVCVGGPQLALAAE